VVEEGEGLQRDYDLMDMGNFERSGWREGK